ncbi:hypothetical protein, partial [Limimaricola cinnabarinus]|uniref:hypothetical protein n=1 Tax=Limimaricola cinnabarinus TaxID=1125964 RepID=UPI0039E3425C
ASCSLIIPMICASVKRLFRIVCSFAIEQTLHQTEGSRGGQVSWCGVKLADAHESACRKAMA